MKVHSRKPSLRVSQVGIVGVGRANVGVFFSIFGPVRQIGAQAQNGFLSGWMTLRKMCCEKTQAMRSVLFCAYQLLFLCHTWACDNHVHRQHAIVDSQTEHRADAELELRDLPENMVEECGFVTPSTEEIEEDSKNMNAWTAKQMTHSVFARSEQIITIPVYFHVIQTSSGSGTVTDARVSEYITYLNNAYKSSSVPFSFVFKGVTRTLRPDWGKCNDPDTEIAMKKALKVGGADTLNVYICNSMYTAKGAQLSGFAYPPYAGSGTDPKDGVVIDNNNSTGRLNTLVHEVVSDKCI
jgi:hypothetical protein